MLTDRQLRFVAAYRGAGTGAAAARAAGYSGTDAGLKAEASKMLRNPGIRAALEERGISLPEMRPGRGAKAPVAPVDLDRAKVGTATDHAALAWRIAQDVGNDPDVRLRAIKLVGELCGELGPGRNARAPEPAQAAKPSEPAKPGLRLVVNADDKGQT